MSRIGKRPIAIPQGVQVTYQERRFHVKGPKGENTFQVPEVVELNIAGEEIKVVIDDMENNKARAMMGTVQACLNNMVTGVSEGFTRRLNLVGVGYRAAVEGRDLNLQLGFSHPVRMRMPEGIQVEMEGQTQIILTSHDNVLLGQTAANIRALRPPEPYQGKGILYENERVRRKAGKAGKK